MRYLVIIAVLLLTACKKEPPPTLQGAEANAPKSVAEQEKEIAARLAEQKAALDNQTREQGAASERNRYTDLVKDVAMRFIQAREESGKTGRSDLGGPIAKIEAIKREAEQIDVDGCTGPVRTTLVAAMTKTLEGLNRFRSMTGEPDAASQTSLQEARTLMIQADEQLAPCLRR